MNTRPFSLLIGLLLACAVDAQTLTEKLYVAVEGEGSIAVFDTASRQHIHSISLASSDEAPAVAPHNVQVAPDGKSVWVTLNSGDHHGHGNRSNPHPGHTASDAPADEVIVINPVTDKIVRRIPLGNGLHLAHVVLTPDSRFAYVTAQNSGEIIRIDAKSFKIDARIATANASQPHGLRIAADGSAAYIALLKGNGLGELNLKTGQLALLPLAGAAVQTAITPDSKTVIVSLYDSKQLAIFKPASRALRYIALPQEAKGPVQLYPTPDSRYVYVADQGHYFSQPDSQWVYKIDLQQEKVVKAIEAGKAPHGIVIAKDGKHAYVSNLVSNDLTIIDLKTDQSIARLPVGHEPNGISLWQRDSGGTP